MTRTSTPWMQTVSGRAVDLVDPDPDSIAIEDVAEHLAKLCRYCGGTRVFYSVAQHSVYVADEIFRLTGDALTAAMGLFHDDHEFAIGDDITPKLIALVAIAREMYGNEFAEQMETVHRIIRYRLSGAIHARYGLPWPPPSMVQAIIKRVDLAMLEVERRDIMAPAPQPWTPTGVEPAPVKIIPWDWEFARTTFLRRFEKYLNRRVGENVVHAKTQREQGGSPS